jgi:hypothetical protein
MKESIKVEADEHHDFSEMFVHQGFSIIFIFSHRNNRIRPRKYQQHSILPSSLGIITRSRLAS